MKRLLLPVIFTIISVASASAQKYEYVDVPNTPEGNVQHGGQLDMNKVRFGAYFSPTITWMHPTASTSDDGNYHVTSKGSKVGYCWGLIAEYYFAQNYGITTGFNVDQEGGKIDTRATAAVDQTQPNTVLNTSFDYRLQFIEIPFALKLRSDALGKNNLRVFGQIGLTAAINISKKASYEVTYNDQTGAEKTVSGDNELLKGALSVPPIMLQLNVGAGIEYPITEKLYFYTGLFFNNGFLPDATAPQNYTLGYKGSFTDANTRLNNFALRVGLFF